jgi:HPt (histidine-containing phosphotransfer) domain-containing protein
MHVDEDSIAPGVFDRLQQATAADPSSVAELYRDYLVDARSALLELRGALLRKHAEEFRSRAHYIKGSSLILGANLVAQYCATLEEMGRQSEFRAAGPLLDKTEAALDRVEAELTRRLGSAADRAKGSAA